MTLAECRDWIRYRLQIEPPLAKGIPGAKAGDQPDYAPDPSNFKIKSAIDTAGKIVNQQVNLSDAGRIVHLPLELWTANGPRQIDLGAVSGLPDRSIRSIRRAWWQDGAGAQPVRLTPFILDQADMTGATYIADAPGMPFQFAIEGYTLYLDPPNSSAGELQFMTGAGVITPQFDSDQFDQIPEDYDISVLYIALVELGKMNMTDATMNQRAANYAPDAAAGLDRLKVWFGGEQNEQAPFGMSFDARAMRRLRRRR